MVEVMFRFDEAVKLDVAGFYGDGVVEFSGDGMYLEKVMLFDNPRDYHSLLYMGERALQRMVNLYISGKGIQLQVEPHIVVPQSPYGSAGVDMCSL